MTNVDWVKIRNEYTTKGTSYRKLAEKHNVSFNTLKDRALREKWKELKTKQRAAIVERSQQKAVEKISEKESDYIVDLAEVNHQLSEKLRAMVLSDDLEPKDLKALTSALKDIRDIQLGIDAGSNINDIIFDLPESVRKYVTEEEEE